MKREIVLIAFLVLINSLCLTAQTPTSPGRIVGKILDDKQNPIEFTTVSLLNEKDSSLVKGVLASQDGEFVFNQVIPGSYIVTVSKLGYKSGSSNLININSTHSIDTLSFIMQKLNNQLEEVEVVVNKPLIERLSDKTIVNVENSSLAIGNTALELLQRAPGVTIDQNGSLSLKGKNSVLVTIDGKSTYLSGNQLTNMLRTILSNNIQSIELISNPSAKYDAQGNAGVINIKLKRNRQFGTNGNISYGNISYGNGYGKYWKTNTGVSINHREKRFNIYGNYDFSSNKIFQDMRVTRANDNGDQTTYFDQPSGVIARNNIHNYKGGGANIISMTGIPSVSYSVVLMIMDQG